jgi:hypothetical protein
MMMMMDTEKRTWEAKTRGKGKRNQNSNMLAKRKWKKMGQKPLKEEKTLITGLVRTTDE